MKYELKASKGYVVQVDECDFEIFSKFKWTSMVHVGKTQTRVYIYRRINGKCMMLHRLIMNAPDGVDVDHINNDTLDNRRSNLRLATRSQNLANNRRAIGRSGYRGVHIDKRNGSVTAQIYQNSKPNYLGRFKDILQAALAYDQAAFLRFGEFAKLNFPLRKL